MSILAQTSATATAAKDSDKDREKEDKDRITRQRIVLRLVADLALVLALPEVVTKGAGEVAKVLKGLVSNATY